MPTTSPKPVGWWEPRWSFAPRALRKFRMAFPIASCLRILIYAAVVTLFIYLAIELFLRPAMPAIQFNWLAAFAQGIGGITVYIAGFLGMQWTIPPRITVSKKGIMIQSGQHVTLVKHEHIRAVHFVFRRNGRHFLRVESSTGKAGSSGDASDDYHEADWVIAKGLANRSGKAFRREDHGPRPTSCRVSRLELIHSPYTVTTTVRCLGLTSHSKWKTCCQVPSTSFPPLTGTVSDGPRIVACRCECPLPSCQACSCP